MPAKGNPMYRPRLLDSLIEKNLSLLGGVYLRGPKWVGKTTSCLQHAHFAYKLLSRNDLLTVQGLYDVDPSLIFEHEPPILFDEWQCFPPIWDECKIFIDANHAKGGRVLLTGSNELSEEKKREYIHHSGLGRIATLFLRPMSLFESGESDGSVSLQSLFEPAAKVNGAKSNLTYKQLVHLCHRGGFPRSLELPYEEAGFVASTIIANLTDNLGFDEEGGVGLSKDRMRLFLSELARNDCTLTSYATMLANIKGEENFPVSQATFERYRYFLNRRYIIEEIPAWSSAFKSRVNIIASPKKTFIDPSLAIAALHLSEADLLSRPADFGFFFENLVLRDLQVYAATIGGSVFHYRDRHGLEADAVLRLNDGRYALIEIKTGGMKPLLEGEKHLLSIKEEMMAYNSTVSDPSAIQALPSALIVIGGVVPTGMTTKNGVHIVPIGCLKP